MIRTTIGLILGFVIGVTVISYNPEYIIDVRKTVYNVEKDVKSYITGLQK